MTSDPNAPTYMQPKPPASNTKIIVIVAVVAAAVVFVPVAIGATLVYAKVRARHREVERRETALRNLREQGRMLEQYTQSFTHYPGWAGTAALPAAPGE